MDEVKKEQTPKQKEVTKKPIAPAPKTEPKQTPKPLPTKPAPKPTPVKQKVIQKKPVPQQKPNPGTKPVKPQQKPSPNPKLASKPVQNKTQPKEAPSKTEEKNQKTPVQKAEPKVQKKKGRLYWLPRIITIIYAALITIFALLSGAESLGSGINGIIRNAPNAIPSLFIWALLYISWRWEKVGGILFIVLAVIFAFFFSTYKSLITFLITVFPLLLVGILFLLSDKLNE